MQLHAIRRETNIDIVAELHKILVRAYSEPNLYNLLIENLYDYFQSGYTINRFEEYNNVLIFNIGCYDGNSNILKDGIDNLLVNYTMGIINNPMYDFILQVPEFFKKYDYEKMRYYISRCVTIFLLKNPDNTLTIRFNLCN